MELLLPADTIAFLTPPLSELPYEVDLPPLTFADALPGEYSSAAGSDVPESPQEDILTKSSAFPAPCEFTINTFYFRSTEPRSDYDIFATFDCNSGELISFTDTLSLVSEIPIEVLQSGFSWTDLHRKEFKCSTTAAQIIERTHSRMKVMTDYLRTPGAKYAVFHEYFAFVTPKGVMKKLELYVVGIERRMEWRAREISQLPASFLPDGVALTGGTEAAAQKPKRIRKPRPPRRKKKVWEDKMNKFTVDPTVPPSLELLMPVPLKTPV